MKKTLSSLKVDEHTLANMKQALAILNKDSILPLSDADYRRFCYEATSQQINKGGKFPNVQLRR